jgi:stage V sporulation protein G
MPHANAPTLATVAEVQITLIKPHDGLIGFANLVWGGCLFLGSIGIHQKLDGSGYRLTYPTRKVGTQNLTLFHPISRQASTAVEQAVFSKLKDVMKNVSNTNAGHARADL